MSGSKKPRRTRSPHPGVVLLKPDPSGRHRTWRARYRDPDTGRMVKERLDPLALSTATTRRDWAIRKAQWLAKRRMELQSGAPQATGTPLADAIERYYRAHPQLRPKTLESYRHATDKLLAWAHRAGIHSVDDLTRAKLMEFRETVVNERKRTHFAGSRRGEQKVTGKRRSPFSINRELRGVRTALGHLVDRDMFAHLSHDGLRLALKRQRAPVERVEYLRPHELQQLLQAALRHDAETFAETRTEHAGLQAVGTTPRYRPIAPFVALLLLTGMRLGEALAVEWRHVDLEALDHDGRTVGEIHLRAAGTKTHHARTVGLEVSPALRNVLAAMKLRDGGSGSVFKLTRHATDAAAKRLYRTYGAPERFGWQMLRRTCGTYLTNAHGIFGAASAYRSAKQLGHSVQVAEKHYVDVARGIRREARTLEAAMQIEEQLAEIARAIPLRATACDSWKQRAARAKV